MLEFLLVLFLFAVFDASADTFEGSEAVVFLGESFFRPCGCSGSYCYGVSVGIGEHSGAGHGEGQFVISDPRGVDDVVSALRSNGLQPVMADYVRTGPRE